jgi:chaperonin cofactor prefoldin
MGTWGTGISSSDTFEDIYSEFFELYNQGLEVKEITQTILQNNKELQSDYEDKNNFWFAIAKAQWECGSLDNDVFEKVKSIILSGQDLKLWKELNGQTNDLKKRKKVLDDFLEKISRPTEKIKKRKKLVIRQPVFKKGDCLIFRLQNGNYGGALVLEAEHETELGMNMLAVTTMNQANKPTLSDFEKADILTERQEGFPGKYKEREFIVWCYVKFFKKAKTKFDIVGQMKDYNSKDHCYMAGHWDTIPSTLDNLENYQKKHGKPELKVKLKEWC